MLCPNCKTELIEVNGRYICSDCGKEVPENEVMTSDWGNSTPAAAGIYDAPTSESVPEEGSMPVATFETSLTESENVPTTQTVEQVLQDQSDDAEAVDSGVEKSPEARVSETVETVLQEQADAAAADKPVEIPPIELDIPAVDVEPEQPSYPHPDSGFYAAPAMPASTALTPAPAVETAEPFQETSAIPTSSPMVSATPSVIPTEAEDPGSLDVARDGNVVIEQISALEPMPVEPTQAIQSIPVTVAAPEMLAPLPESVAAVPQQQEVVKDMFEDIPAAPINDPGLYSNNFEETSGNNPAAQPIASVAPQLSSEKKTNILILAAGVVLALCLIGGGTWAYIALNKKAVPVVVPVVETPAASWSELQVVDAGFKISFPGQPEKTESTHAIGGLDTPVITESYTTDDSVYTAAYATVNASIDELPSFVTELANLQNLDVVTTKVGTYFNANAIDFTLGKDSASYQGKIILEDNTYILVMAGSSSGQTVDYAKFIKSFSFVAASTGDTTN